MGIRVDNGGSPNSDGDETSVGELDLADIVPVDVTGKVKVSGELRGEGGTCKGSGWVEFVGSPAFTPIWILALVLLVAGGAVLYAAQPRKVWSQ
jgi:hypothetical protein